MWSVFVRMPYDVRGGASFVLTCGVVPLAPSFTTYLVSSFTHVWPGKCRMHWVVSCCACVSYLCFPMVRCRGRVVVFRAFFVFGLVSLPLFCFPFFSLTRSSCLALMARTLLSGLGHAMFKFSVVAARLFLVFCVCPNFDDLAKQRRKTFGGFLRSEKTIYLFMFDGCTSISWFFIFLCCDRARHQRSECR